MMKWETPTLDFRSNEAHTDEVLGGGCQKKSTAILRGTLTLPVKLRKSSSSEC